MKIVCLVVLLFINSLKGEVVEEFTQVQDVPDLGFLAGSGLRTDRNESYTSFRNIKYGEVIDWFQPAIEAENSDEQIPNTCVGWLEEVYEAEILNDHFNRDQCLTLNVDTKNVEGAAPVMVHIPSYFLDYGEDILDGTQSRLLNNDIVLVTVQYRVGPLGFLSTNTTDIPGNVGMLDVILALKWIQKHISHFGGDPTRVTLFGQYNAAGLITALSVSPLASGLFHRMILHSGSSGIETLTTNNPLEFARKFGTELGCSDVDDVAKLNECIKGLNHRKLATTYSALLKKLKGRTYPITLNDVHGVLPGDEDVGKRILNTKTTYDVIGGTVDNPGVSVIEKYNDDLHSHFSEHQIRMDNLDYIKKFESETVSETISKQLLAILFGEKERNSENVDTVILQEIAKVLWPVEIDLLGLKIRSGIVHDLLRYSAAGGKTYLFGQFYNNHKHFIEPLPEFALKGRATKMGDDFQFIFGNEPFTNLEDLRTSILYVEYWTSFAATGVPISSLDWPQLVDDGYPYFVQDGFNLTNVDRTYYNEVMPINYCLTSHLVTNYSCFPLKNDLF